MTPLNLLIAVLAVGYLAYVVVYTDGMGARPATATTPERLGVFAWIRKHDPIQVTHCPWCISAWLALAVIAVFRWDEPFSAMWLVEAFAAAGGAMMALAWTGAKHM